MPRRSSSACSTPPACARSTACSCRNTPTRYGTATCRTRGRARSTAIASMVPTIRAPATASTRTSCCSIPMPGRSTAGSCRPKRIFGYRVGSAREDLSFDRRDSARAMPKCRVVDGSLQWGDDRPPGTPWSDSILYETHVRGFTMLHPALAAAAARHLSPAWAAEPVIDYLRSLGITAIELLPVQARFDEPHLLAAWPQELLGLQHHRLLRARSAAAVDRPRPPSSRPWSGSCTTPASR